MTIRIERGDKALLDAYAEVPIGFLVTNRLVAEVPAGPEADFTAREEPVAPPYWYDYDDYDPPTRWPHQWDLGNWLLLLAFDGAQHVGGAAIARLTPGLPLIETDPSVASLWDIRVRPEWRGTGVGNALFKAAMAAASAAGAKVLKIETQDINAHACRFYARQGCRLERARGGAYAHAPEQVELIWSIALR